MKKITILLAFLCPLFLAAQVEFAPVGATWYFDYDYGAPWKLGYAKVEVTGIDTIQGRACKRIESKNHLGGIDWGCSYFYPVLQVYQKNDLVYFYREGTFQLLYNFGAQVGESWAVKIPPFSSNDSLIILVDSVYTIQVNGQDLRVQRVNFPNQIVETVMDWGSVIVEGVGNLEYAVPQHGLCDPQIYGLRCYQDDSLDLQFISYPCDSVKHYVDTRESIIRSGLFTPNPVLGNTVVLADNIDADRIVLQNALGATKKTFLFLNGRTLEIADVEPGVYFATIFQGLRLVGTDKLIIIGR